MSDNELVSLAEAQKRIGFRGDDQGRRLFRELESREGRLGFQIMTRRPGPQQVRCLVTVAAIKLHACDLVEVTAQSLEREVRQYLSAIDEKVDKSVAEQIERRVNPQLKKLRDEQKELKDQDTRTLQLVLGLTKRVDSLASQVTTSHHESPK